MKKAGIIFLLFFICLPSFVLAETIEEKEERLKAELEIIELEKAKIQKDLDLASNESASIERDVKILTAQIEKAKLQIKEKNIAIERLGKDINDKNTTITELSEQIDRGKESMGQIIRKMNELDSYSLPEIVMQSRDLSDFFVDVDAFNEVNSSLEVLFEDLRGNQVKTGAERDSLSKKRNDEINIKAEIEAEKRNIEIKETEKNRLLALAKLKELGYAQAIAEKEKKAAQIRAALFELRDTDGISFGEALEYAKVAQKKTGVRPAFLLSILTQESNLGKNIGTCNRPGDPPEKKWKAIMPGPGDKSYRNDEAVYIELTSSLGLDPDSMPLSCPYMGGWGGAMGPAQFIPTTWKAYASRIASAVGKKVASPWVAQDAFMASAIYLSDLGAGAGTYTAERTAALKYYAGSNWNKPSNAFYGNQVMSRVQSIQENIDFLEGV